MKPLFVAGRLEALPYPEGVFLEPSGPEARIRGTLYALPAGYPAISLTGRGYVEGFLLTPRSEATLRVLDALEDPLSTRREVRALWGLRAVDAWVYEHPHPETSGGQRLPDGVWRRRRRR